MLYVIFDDECDLYGVYNNVSTMLVHYEHMINETENKKGHVLVGAFDEFGASFGFKEPDEYLQSQIDEIAQKAAEDKND